MATHKRGRGTGTGTGQFIPVKVAERRPKTTAVETYHSFYFSPPSEISTFPNNPAIANDSR